MNARGWLVAVLLVAIGALASIMFRLEHAPANWEYRTEQVDWSQLETKLRFLGTGGWELMAVSPDKTRPDRLWATLRRRGSAPSYRRAPPPNEKDKGRGPVPQYRESPI